MKVLHLTGEREDVGGVLSVIRNVQSASSPSECRHYVCVHVSYVETRRPSLDYRFSRHIIGDDPNHFYLLRQSILTYFELKKLLARERFDLLHAHTRGGLIAAFPFLRRTRLPVVFTNHAYARRVGLYQWMARRTRLSTVVLTPNMARHYGLAENPPRVSVISDCCADSCFQESLAKDPPPPNGRAIRFAGIGSITRWKNWHLIVSAMRLLTQDERARIEFSLWGPTPEDADSQRYDPELRAAVQASGLADCFLFRGTTNQVADVLRSSDWFVLPSTNEPCSVALIEALAIGVPVLVSRSGGNVDIVEPERSGVLFAPDDPQDLAAQIRRILRGDVKPIGASERRESVRHRSGSHVAAQYLALYRSLLEGK